jgi:hypothetical protein
MICQTFSVLAIPRTKPQSRQWLIGPALFVSIEIRQNPEIWLSSLPFGLHVPNYMNTNCVERPPIAIHNVNLFG